MTSVNLKVYLVGYYCKHWPRVRVLHQGKIIWDGEVSGHAQIDLELQADSADTVVLEHYGKRFGEDGVWDSDSAGNDCYVTVTDIKFDDVSVGEKFLSQLIFKSVWTEQQRKLQDTEFLKNYEEFCSNGMMSFNGRFEIMFELPVYNWLIVKKFKVEKVDTAYFSNYSLRWHYEKDLKLIDEIKEIMNFD